MRRCREGTRPVSLSPDLIISRRRQLARAALRLSRTHSQALHIPLRDSCLGAMSTPSFVRPWRRGVRVGARREHAHARAPLHLSLSSSRSHQRNAPTVAYDLQLDAHASAPSSLPLPCLCSIAQRAPWDGEMGESG